MSRHIGWRRLASACATAIICVLVLAHPAGAAVVAADTRPVSCGATAIWLRLWGSFGERCYTGAGTEMVSLPGVDRAQLTGAHQACLTGAAPAAVRCLAGQGTFRITAPIRVVQIRITTL